MEDLVKAFGIAVVIGLVCCLFIFMGDEHEEHEKIMQPTTNYVVIVTNYVTVTNH